MALWDSNELSELAEWEDSRDNQWLDPRKDVRSWSDVVIEYLDQNGFETFVEAAVSPFECLIRMASRHAANVKDALKQFCEANFVGFCVRGSNSVKHKGDDRRGIEEFNATDGIASALYLGTIRVKRKEPQDLSHCGTRYTPLGSNQQPSVP